MALAVFRTRGMQGVDVRMASGRGVTGVETSRRNVRPTLPHESQLTFRASRASDAEDAQNAYNNFC